HVAFHRAIGEFADVEATPEGILIDEATWTTRHQEWLPSAEDGQFIASLMQPVTEVGQFAPWISPPKVGIDNRPGEFAYVQIETCPRFASPRLWGEAAALLARRVRGLSGN